MVKPSFLYRLWEGLGQQWSALTVNHTTNFPVDLEEPYALGTYVLDFVHDRFEEFFFLVLLGHIPLEEIKGGIVFFFQCGTGQLVFSLPLDKESTQGPLYNHASFLQMGRQSS